MKAIGRNQKTLYSSVEASMVDDIHAFHNKGNLFVDEHFRGHMIPFAISLGQLQALEKSDSEILPFHDQDIECLSDYVSQTLRDRSAQKFLNNKVSLSKVFSLLKTVFACKKDGSRSYPSGGALYPVEVVLAVYQERLQETMHSGLYHYRPTLNVLQPLIKMSSENIRKTIYQMETAETGNPAFSLIYVGHLAKMLVKYRLRGYRYALMETGAMFQQADLIAKELGLTNKLYSGFNDHELSELLGLDKLNFIPLIVQSFGGMT